MPYQKYTIKKRETSRQKVNYDQVMTKLVEVLNEIEAKRGEVWSREETNDAIFLIVYYKKKTKKLPKTLDASGNVSLLALRLSPEDILNAGELEYFNNTQMPVFCMAIRNFDKADQEKLLDALKKRMADHQASCPGCSSAKFEAAALRQLQSSLSPSLDEALIDQATRKLFRRWARIGFPPVGKGFSLVIEEPNRLRAVSSFGSGLGRIASLGGGTHPSSRAFL